MNELSHESRALFEAAQTSDAPAPGAQERLRGLLDARIALIAAAAPTAAASAPWAASGVAGVVAKVAIGTVLALGSGVAVWRVAHARAPVPAPIAQATLQAPPNVDEATDGPESEETAAPPAQADVKAHPWIRPWRHHHAVHKATPIVAGAPAASAGMVVPERLSPEDSLRREVELLSQAQDAMRGHNPQRALYLLDEHAARFPTGKLLPERVAAHVLVLCELGRTSEAELEARSFILNTPSSPLVERLRASCAFRSPP